MNANDNSNNTEVPAILKSKNFTRDENEDGYFNASYITICTKDGLGINVLPYDTDSSMGGVKVYGNRGNEEIIYFVEDQRMYNYGQLYVPELMNPNKTILLRGSNCNEFIYLNTSEITRVVGMGKKSVMVKDFVDELLERFGS